MRGTFKKRREEKRSDPARAQKKEERRENIKNWFKNAGETLWDDTIGTAGKSAGGFFQNLFAGIKGIPNIIKNTDGATSKANKLSKMLLIIIPTIAVVLIGGIVIITRKSSNHYSKHIK